MIQFGARLIAVLSAVSLTVVWAQDPFPPMPPNGYMPSGQTPGGYNPVPGSYQPSVAPSQPLVPIRPNTFPGGPTPPIITAETNPAVASPTSAAPGYGPLYQAGQPVAGAAVQATYLGQQPARPVAPAQLCPGAQIIARVGSDVVLTSDLPCSIDDIMAPARGKMPPEKFAQQRAALAEEVMAGIQELNAHYQDPDPGKAVSLAHRGLLNQLMRRQIDVKLIYQDFLKTVPKEQLPTVEESLQRHFEDNMLPVLMKRENVVSRADLENALRAKGSSLDREKRIFKEQTIAQEWVRQKVKPEGGGDNGEKGKEKDEVTHEEMRTWYQAHLTDFEQPAKARWEELMVAFARHANRDEAYAAVAALGNRVVAGASFADVAKSASEGPTARQGGQRDWTHPGGLSSDTLDHAIFSLPVGNLSPILESQNGFHIIRVVERKELSRTSFLDAQKEVKERIQKERVEKRYTEFVEDLRKKYPIWTVFDSSLQQPKDPDEEDRYSMH